MEDRYISNIKSTKRTLRFMHSKQDEEIVIDANYYEFMHYRFTGILSIYHKDYGEECINVSQNDFFELQKEAMKTQNFMPFKKYIINLSKIDEFWYDSKDLTVSYITKNNKRYDIEIQSEEDFRDLVKFLSRRYKISTEDDEAFHCD